MRWSEGLHGASLRQYWPKGDAMPDLPDLHSSDWKPLVYGIDIGALAGAGVGLTLGVVAAAKDKPGRAPYVVRDMAYGEGWTREHPRQRRQQASGSVGPARGRDGRQARLSAGPLGSVRDSRKVAACAEQRG